MTVLIVLGIWFVSSVVFGLLAAHFLRFSEASSVREQIVARSPQDTFDDDSDLSPSLIASRE